MVNNDHEELTQVQRTAWTAGWTASGSVVRNGRERPATARPVTGGPSA